MKLYNLIIIFSTAMLAACTSHIHTPLDQNYRYKIPTSRSLDLNYFEYDHRLPEYQRETVDVIKRGNYKKSVLSLPSIGENGQQSNLINTIYYASTLSGKKPLVIILPLYGAYTYPPEEMTEDILQRSKGRINVLHMQGKRFMIDWQSLKSAATPKEFRQRLDDTVERMRINVIDVRRLVDWARTESDIDEYRIGLLGFSHGAIVAGMVTLAEPRISSSVLVMGGANPGEIIANCHLERTDSLRDTIMKKFAWNDRQYVDSLTGVFDKVNPIHYSQKPDARRILIVESLYDECVPESARHALWESMGRPERYQLKYGHRMSFMAMTPLSGNFMRRIIYNFLQDGLLNSARNGSPLLVNEPTLDSHIVKH